MSVRPKNTATYSVGNGGQKLFGVLLCLLAYLRHPTAICSSILCNFSTAELSKALKKANNRLNATWNMTQCKAASYFLFSLRLLPTNLPYTSITRISVVRVLLRICAQVALMVLHFSAFIYTMLNTDEVYMHKPAVTIAT